jgi:predicted AAA+ superfamily ATPase
MTLSERGVHEPTVSFASLFGDEPATMKGRCDLRLAGYVDEIIAGGFPGMRNLDDRNRSRAFDGYVTRITDVDLPEIGIDVRHPMKMRRWLTAYAAASATTTSWEKIRNAATPNDGEKPARSTTIPYRDALERLWVLDPLDAWPGFEALSR